MEMEQRLEIQGSVDRLVVDAISARVIADSQGNPKPGAVYYRRGMLDKEKLPDAIVSVILNHLEHIGWRAEYKPESRETFAVLGERDICLDGRPSNRSEYFEHVFKLEPIR